MTLVDVIAQEFKLDTDYLFGIITCSDYCYKDYYINKRDGGIRHISQASPELKSMQYWVVENVLKKLPVSSGAYAYKKGDSIKKHASIHRTSNHIFHTDIKNFFENIKFDMIKPILEDHKNIFDSLEADFNSSLSTIKKICFRGDFLCIGTVSSPIVSNVIMYDFDQELLNYCEKCNYTYSRYADDIYISSKDYIPEEVKDYVQKALKSRGFEMNTKKTSFISKKHRRKVTGLILTNDGIVSIGTGKRNEIKKMVYKKLVHGEGNPEQILGFLAFLKDVEPYTYNKIIIKYSKYCQGDIIDNIADI